MMKNKVWSIGLALLLLCSLWPSALFAAPVAEPDFYMNVSRAEVKVGETIEVELGLRNAQDLVAYELNVMFDSDLWTAGNDAFTTKLKGFSSLVNTELLAAGQVRGVYTKLGAEAGDSGNIILGTVKLTAKAVGEGEIRYGAIKLGHSTDEWLNETPAVKASARIVGGDGGPGDGPGNGPGNGGDSGAATGNEPVITETSVVVEAPLIAGGTAQVKLTDAHMLKAVSLMNGSALNIKVKPGSSADKVEVAFPLAQIRGEAGQKLERIAIDSGLAVVTLDRGLLGEETASGGSLQLVVTKLDSSMLPADMGEHINAGEAVYDFQLLLDGRPVRTFEAGEVTVEVPYTLQPGETADKIMIYYMSPAGGLELVKNAKYNAATGTATFSPQHFSLYFPAYVHRTFGDLGEAAWARSYIEALAAREAVNGVGDNAFRPNGQLTRAQFVTMLVQLFDLEDATAVATFSDAKRDTWYYGAVSSAQKLGIVTGKTDGSFGINDAISRQDMAVMLYRASRAMGLAWHSSGEEPAFADAASIAPYAKEAIAVMKEQGIMDGMGDNSFVPRGISTRAQAAAVLYRMFGL